MDTFVLVEGDELDGLHGRNSKFVKLYIIRTILNSDYKNIQSSKSIIHILTSNRTKRLLPNA
jgi:hypothetical protein